MILLKLRKWEISLKVVNKGWPLKKRPQVRKIPEEIETLRISRISALHLAQRLKNSLNEKITAIEEGHYEHTPQPFLSLPPVYFSFFLFLLTYFHLSVSFTFHFSRLHHNQPFNSRWR